MTRNETEKLKRYSSEGPSGGGGGTIAKEPT